MAIILVTYDLNAPGKNYKPVHEHLKKFTHCKCLESVWLLDTDKTTATIRDELEAKIDSNDSLFVVKLAKNWAAINFSCAEWLKKTARRW